MTPHGFYLPTPHGPRYALFHAPQGEARGQVLYLHPFAEELNRTRRMAALQARQLAQAGYAVLQFDLLGCGDSAGDFRDATWAHWLEDVDAARSWLERQTGRGPLWLWGLRLGCLLAADYLRQQALACHLLFWQASFTSGAQQLQQFLRLRLAADLLATSAGAGQGAMAALQQELAEGRAVDVAGYSLAPAMAAGLRASRLDPVAPVATTPRLVWLETSAAHAAGLSPGGLRTLQAWQGAGWLTQSGAVQGPAFWQSTEIEEAPALLEATLQALTMSARSPESASE
nr:hydrolase 2, exosortase A system-associated [Variovorax boronicumulans]